MMTGSVPKAETPEALQARMEDDQFVDELVKRGEVREYFDAYDKAMADKQNKAVQDLLTKIDEQTQTTLAKMLKENGGTANTPTLEGSPVATNGPRRKVLNYSATGTGHNARALGAGLDNLDYDAADYIRAAYHNKGVLDDSGRYFDLEAKVNSYKAQYSGTSPADGGILLPEVLRSEIMEISLETSLVRNRATVIPMAGGSLKIPQVKADSNANNLFGGIKAYWEDETAAPAETSATFAATKLEPKSLRALSDIPNELLADAAALEAFIAAKLPEAVAWYEDFGFIEGNGVGKPLGFKNAECVVSVAKEGSQTADTINSKNIFKMVSRLLPTSRGRAVWLANNDTLPQLAELNVAVGTGGNTIWLPSAREGAPDVLMGMPLIFTEKMETLGDSGDIMLVDLKYYLIGDRQTMELTSSPHSQFRNNVTEYMCIDRVDGRPWLQNAITPAKSTATVSPFVKLDARA